MKNDILVEQTLAGDHQAFNSLITDYYADIYGMILSWVDNPDDAKDLTQDVFISAYLDLPSLKDHSRFYYWLRQIAKHKCQNWRRKQIDFIPLHDDLISKEPSTDETLILRETLAKVMEAIDSLPESEKVLLKERYLDDLGYDELEARHGVSAKALVVRLVRARRKIRDQLEKTLSTFVAFFHDHTESILTGGTEIVKISVKAKLIAGGILLLLVLSGTGVSINRYYARNKSEREISQISQESNSELPIKSVSSSEMSSKKGAIGQRQQQPQPKRTNEDSEISNEKEDIKQKVASETAPSKAGNNPTGISPELERMFVKFKELVDQNLAIAQETAPLHKRFGELVKRENELYDAIDNTSGEEFYAIRAEINRVT